jgi:hypothetical protein
MKQLKETAESNAKLELTSEIVELNQKHYNEIND